MSRGFSRAVVAGLLVPVVLVIAGCSPAGPVATVDGVAIEPTALTELHPSAAQPGPGERASNLFLIILHRLLSESAEDQFGFVVSDEQRQVAFDARTNGMGSDVDAALRERGVTRNRVLLESDLDVIRAELERRLVEAEAPGFDFEAAYRTFLSVNSRVCMSALHVSDRSAVADVEQLVAAGSDLEDVMRAYPDAVEPVEVDCGSPTRMGPGLASVALDGVVGDVHVVSTDGGSYVATVDERDAPPPDSVRNEVYRIAVETQGPEIFNDWAAEILRGADVEVDGAIGRWEPIEGSNGIPTVVAD